MERTTYAIAAALILMGIEARAGNDGCASGSRGAGWGIGVKGGVNSATAESEEFEGERNRLGFNGGLMFEIGSNMPFSLAFEPTLVAKGAQFEVEETVRRAELMYLELPVLLRVNLPLGPFIRVYGLAGPDLAINLDADFEREVQLTETDVEPFDLILDVGGGAGIRILPGMTLIGEVRYSHGFMGVLKEDTESPNEEWNVRDLKLSTGFMINFPSG